MSKMFSKVCLSALRPCLGSRLETESNQMDGEKQRNKKDWGPEDKFCLFLRVVWEPCHHSRLTGQALAPNWQGLQSDVFTALGQWQGGSGGEEAPENPRDCLLKAWMLREVREG